MGVRGLTTFIASNAEVYLKPYELHDTNLVIDGDNLCIQLFKKSQLTSSPLGGNYDLYHRIVVDFFKMLSLCNVVPYVLLDGGYEARKMATVKDRMLQNIRSIKRFSIASTASARPLMLREVFVDALRTAGVSVMRCAFEADDEVAILARKLNCPVMSYDSDFYIHNVQYIPYVTLTHKVYRKVTDKTGDNFEIGIVEWTKTGTARKSSRIKFVAQYGDEKVVNSDEAESYCYMDCCMYSIDSLIGPNARLQKDMIPLFAVLLGNDYIERRVLAPFYSTIRCGRVNRKINRQQRRVRVILKWLQYHTIPSATRAIVNHVQGAKQKQIYRQILTAMRGYNCEECAAFRYFGFSEETTDVGRIEDEEIQKQIQDGLGAEGCEDVIDAVNEEDCSLDEEEDEEHVEQSDEEEGEETDTEPESAGEYESEEDFRSTNLNGSVEEGSTCPDNGTDTDEDAEGDDFESLEPFLNKYTDHSWPEWFRELYRSARVPRFLADLLHSNCYVNYPQKEDISKPDSNTISYPILRTIFAILKQSCKRPTEEFKYLSRTVKVAGICHIAFDDVKLPNGVTFEPESPGNVSIVKALFKQCNVNEWQELYRSIRSLPAHLQLYFLIIIYWAKNCTDVNEAHVQALIVCLLQLQIVDPSLKSKNRDAKLFHAQHSAVLEEQRRKAQKTTTPQNGDSSPPGRELTRAFYNQLTGGTSRTELLLVYATLIGYFAPNEKLNRKHTPVDRTIVHTFAEFQSVCFNFYALVPLLGYPFENVRMYALFNSMLVYNVYETIRTRPNPSEYVCTAFYRHSQLLQSAFRRMVELVERYVPELHTRKRSIKGKAKVAAKKDGKAVGRESTPKTKCAPPARSTNKATGSVPNDTSESDNEIFVDMNNKFSQLLLAS